MKKEEKKEGKQHRHCHGKDSECQCKKQKDDKCCRQQKRKRNGSCKKDSK